MAKKLVIKHDEFEMIFALYGAANAELIPNSKWEGMNAYIKLIKDFLFDQKEQVIPWVCVDKSIKVASRSAATVAIERAIYFENKGDVTKSLQELQAGLKKILRILVTTDDADSIFNKNVRPLCTLHTAIAKVMKDGDGDGDAAIELLYTTGPLVRSATKKELNHIGQYLPSAIEMATNR